MNAWIWNFHELACCQYDPEERKGCGYESNYSARPRQQRLWCSVDQAEG